LDQQTLTKQYEADRLLLIKEIESLKKQIKWKQSSSLIFIKELIRFKQF
jgi:hypothetical protein